MEIEPYINRLHKVNNAIFVIQELINKLKFLESSIIIFKKILVQFEINKHKNNFNLKLNHFVKVINTVFNLNITNQQVVNVILNYDQTSLEMLKNLGINMKLNFSTELDSLNKMSTESVNNEKIDSIENIKLKEKYLEALNKRDPKRHFQVYYVFKSKIKRMYRIDCMTRKINVNFYHYLRDNLHNLNINNEFLDFYRSNIRFTSREKFQELNKKYPQFTEIYNTYLNSSSFKKLISVIKRKYDKEYQKLFFRHSINFLNFFLKEKDIVDITSKKKNEGKKKMLLRKLNNL